MILNAVLRLLFYSIFFYPILSLVGVLEDAALRVHVPSFGQWVTIFYRLNFENPPTVLTPR